MKIEHNHQRVVVNFLAFMEARGKIVAFFAVPNGGSRNAREAKNLKLEGVRAGVSDLVVVLKNRVLFIEMKRPPKKLKNGNLSYAGISVSKAQKEFLEKVAKSYVCVSKVCYGSQEAIEYIKENIEELK